MDTIHFWGPGQSIAFIPHSVSTTPHPLSLCYGSHTWTGSYRWQYLRFIASHELFRKRRGQSHRKRVSLCRAECPLYPFTPGRGGTSDPHCVNTEHVITLYCTLSRDQCVPGPVCTGASVYREQGGWCLSSRHDG